MIGYTTITQKGQITIPAQIRKKYELKKGRKVMVKSNKNEITISTLSDFFALQGSVKPRRKKVDFKAMRESYEKYLGTPDHLRKIK